MTTLEIKALDTLFFRDGKPFSMGEETMANGVFPPYPSTLYGTLRSIYFADHLSDLDKVKVEEEDDETLDPTFNFHINGYLPSLNGQPAFPIPQDLYGKKLETANKAWKLQCKKIPQGLLSDHPFDCLLQTQETVKVKELGGSAFLDATNFKDYLLDAKEVFSYLSAEDYITDEPKIGMGRNFNTRGAEEGRLYRVNMKRPQGREGELSFLVSYDGLNLPEAGISRMGAETKAVDFSQKEFPRMEQVAGEDAQYIKIYLATPAIFQDGFYPAKYFAEKGMKLLAAAIGRVQPIGGFDYLRTFPKPMLKAVPAGTVYFVEIVDRKKAEGVIESLHGGSVYNLFAPDDPFRKAYQKQGFGLSYVGLFNIQ